jgi:hypothetical protein
VRDRGVGRFFERHRKYTFSQARCFS